MKTQHNPHHWVAVALVLAALLLTLSEAHGRAGTASREVAARSVKAEPALRKDAAPARDKSLAKEQRSARKATRAVKRSISRSRHGNAPVDAGIASR